MKVIICILKNIFTPFSAFAFLFLGLLACFCSAMIEFYVLKELLEVPGLGIPATSWAILIVLVLEGSKFTLHYYGEALKRCDLSETIEDFDVIKKRRLIVAIKNSLVVLSLTCSIICFVNILYNNSEQKIDSYVHKSNEYCDQQLEEGIKKLDEKRRSRLAEEIELYSVEKTGIEEQKILLQTTLERISNEPYINRRQDLQEEAEAIRNQINTLELSYASHIETAQIKIQEEYDAALKDLEAKYGDNGTERKSINDIEVMMEGDNPYLSNFLNALTKTFGGNGYSRITYFFSSLAFSIIIAIALELCISISQMLLSIKVETFLKIIGDIPKIDKGINAIRLSIWLLFSVLIATAVYCIASIILHTNMQEERILMAILTYLVTILLVNAFIPRKNGTKIINYFAEKNRKAEPWVKGLLNIISEAVFPAALAFVGYILIGFIFKGDFIYTDMTGLAIAIGGAFSKIVQFDQCEFKI